MVKNDRTLLAAELLQIAGFHIAENLQTHRLKVIKKTCQLQTGTAHIVNSDTNLMKIG